MPLLRIDHNYVSESEVNNFKWGDEWRAERIWRELKGDGEYLFASCRKNYGIIEGSHELDLGRKQEDYCIIGRVPDRVGERGPDVDPKSPTFGKRVYKKPQISEEYNEETKKWEPISYGNSTLVHKYYCEATPENLEKFRTMFGKLDNGRNTQLIFVFSSYFIDIQNLDVFFDIGDAVRNYETTHFKRINDDPEERWTEKLAEALKSRQVPQIEQHQQPESIKTKQRKAS